MMRTMTGRRPSKRMAIWGIEIMLLKPRVMAGIAVIASATLAPAAIGAAQHGTLAYLCTNLASHATWRINIDLGRNTVDSNPARISGAKISWRDREGGHYTLDRRSGDLTVIFASSTGGYLLHDRCQPAH